MAEPIYTTYDLVRAEPEVPDATVDADLATYVLQAEDALDAWLGSWPINDSGPSAGRKIVQANIFDWQWGKLQRAATRLSARLFDNPELLIGPEYQKTGARGTTQEGWRGLGTRMPDVLQPLNESGLRRLTARGRP